MNIYDLWGHWAVLSIDYEEVTAGSKIQIVTNNAIHATMKWKKTPPFLRKTWKWIRGLKVFCKPILVWRGATLQAQDEAGDTLIHTFTPAGWPVCETHWFMFTGTNGGEATFSKSPMFNHHHAAVPYGPPVTVKYYPDPHPEANACDGIAERYVANQDWSNIHGGSGNIANAWDVNVSVYIYAGTLTNKWNCIARTFLLFNTLALPAGSLILSAKVYVRCSSTIKQLSGDSTVTIVASYPNYNIDINPVDYGHIYATPISDIIPQATFVATHFQAFILNAAGLLLIEQAGITKFGMRFYTYDCSGGAPAWASGKVNQLVCNSRDAALGYSPYLEVTYQPPA